MTILGGILFSSDLFDSAWYQALAGFVAVNTVIFAILALGKLIPRRRA